MKRQRTRLAVMREVMDDDNLWVEVNYPIAISYEEFINNVRDAFNTILLGTQSMDWDCDEKHLPK